MGADGAELKVVTVCEHGLNRSVVARWLLQQQGHEVIPVGLERHSDATLTMLYDWADRIVVLDARLSARVPAEKLVVWDVGPDVYPHHYHPDLVRRLRAFPALDPCHNG
jgi:hypothetical protein